MHITADATGDTMPTDGRRNSPRFQRDMEELGFVREEFDDSFSSDDRRPPNIMRDMSLLTQYLILVG